MSSSIQYQGRQARRTGSEQRRKSILEAALRIIISDGIRGVRHRAVAKEADVPLSATTYYFRDIHELIADTFTLFAEQAMAEVVRPFQEQALQLIHAAPKIINVEQSQQLIDILSQALCNYVYDSYEQKPEHLLAEQAFYQEALLNEKLGKLALLYRKEQTKVVFEACKLLDIAQPEMAAELILNQINMWEQTLLLEAASFTRDDLLARIKYMLTMLLD